ncbi:polysaccharide deacetylase family protein [Autumnicola musiva]|uniref:Polysaccharide deacetylase family protein n=1 Tax=Autumnicola musiva TaxID=3075589 RepID=A0ABU3D0M4_9FLAO|nr:polysaccharide deacetylase family protein [Zunongwangia sp. F117]MDT0675090.1 polysaccharide deacetylase family protein [Zunongwangia sp. F117]
MNKFMVKYPAVLKWLYPRRLARLKESQVISITFDDGPIPEITPWVLELLKKYNAKATFFCIGDNVRKKPELFRRIISEGHSIGNHTHNHLNGWKTSTSAYMENILQAEEIMNAEVKLEKGKSKRGIAKLGEKETTNTRLQTPNYKLFRPPYGKIKNSQARELSKSGYKIVMWDVISYDFNKNLSQEDCLQNVLRHATEGSIIVFHDSTKAFKNLETVLPQVLEYYSRKGYKFRRL